MKNVRLLAVVVAFVAVPVAANQHINQLKGFNATVSEHIFAESFAYFANKVK